AVAVPPVPGAELGLTSDSILGLDHVPESLVVIGGGGVGMGFAGVFSLLGTEVTVIGMLDPLLGPLGPGVARRFHPRSARRGSVFHLGARFEEIGQAGGRVRVCFGGGELESEQVLVATGRRPNIADLGLEQAGVGVAKSQGAIVVDQQLRTNVDGVYAIGDATGISMLAHAASYQGEIAVTNALGERR